MKRNSDYESESESDSESDFDSDSESSWKDPDLLIENIGAQKLRIELETYVWSWSNPNTHSGYHHSGPKYQYETVNWDHKLCEIFQEKLKRYGFQIYWGYDGMIGNYRRQMDGIKIYLPPHSYGNLIDCIYDHLKETMMSGHHVVFNVRKFSFRGEDHYFFSMKVDSKEDGIDKEDELKDKYTYEEINKQILKDHLPSTLLTKV